MLQFKSLTIENREESIITMTDPLSSAFPKLLHIFQDIFKMLIGHPPPRTKEHSIILQPRTAPIFVWPYRYRHHLQKIEIERLVARMLQEGIIQPSMSPYFNMVLLVRKKYGSWQFYIDYRALNKVTMANKFLIPVIEELLDELHGVTALYVPKATFQTHDKHYEFFIMPFKLANTPVTFHSLMNDIFKDHFVLLFFDDILVYSTSKTDHLSHLQVVFQIPRTTVICQYKKLCIPPMEDRVTGSYYQ